MRITVGQQLDDALIHPSLAAHDHVDRLDQAIGRVGRQENPDTPWLSARDAGGGIDLLGDRQKLALIASLARLRNEVLPDAEVEQNDVGLCIRKALQALPQHSRIRQPVQSPAPLPADEPGSSGTVPVGGAA